MFRILLSATAVTLPVPFSTALNAQREDLLRTYAMVNDTLEARGLAAWVECGANKLECYGIGSYRTQYAENMSCWIASEENKTFAVRFAKRSRAFACVAHLYLDGKWMARRMFKPFEEAEFCFHDKRTAESTMPFVFCSQSVVDDDSLLEQNLLNAPAEQDAEYIGEITVKVERITDIMYEPKRPPRRHRGGGGGGGGGGGESGLPPIKRIHETSVKAKKPPHQISFGEGTKREPEEANGGSGGGGGYGGYRGGGQSMRPTYTTCEVIATFTFRYRPIELLIENGIITNHTNAPSVQQQSAAEQAEIIHVQRVQDEDDDDIYEQENKPAAVPPPSAAAAAGPSTHTGAFTTPARDRRALSWLNTPARERATPTTAILQNAALLQHANRHIEGSTSTMGTSKAYVNVDEDVHMDDGQSGGLNHHPNEAGPSGSHTHAPSPMVKPEVGADVVEIKDEEELELLARLQAIRNRKRKAPETPLRGSALRKASRTESRDDGPLPKPFFPPGVEVEVIDLT